MKTNTVTVSAGLIPKVAPKVAPAVAPLPLNAVPSVYLFNLNHLLVSTDMYYNVSYIFKCCATSLSV